MLKYAGMYLQSSFTLRSLQSLWSPLLVYIAILMIAIAVSGAGEGNRICCTSSEPVAMKGVQAHTSGFFSRISHAFSPIFPNADLTNGAGCPLNSLLHVMIITDNTYRYLTATFFPAFALVKIFLYFFTYVLLTDFLPIFT